MRTKYARLNPRKVNAFAVPRLLEPKQEQIVLEGSARLNLDPGRGD